jgi:hypothetical protein
MTDFLDDSWPHRSYWVFGTRPSMSTGCSGRDRNLIYGRLLVFDDSSIYGYGRANVHWSNQLEDGPYRLFSTRRGEVTPRWQQPLPIRARAMILAGDVLFAAGPPVGSAAQPAADGSDHPAARLLAISSADGKVLANYPLDRPPEFDGMAAVAGRIFIALEDGGIVAFAGKN